MKKQICIILALLAFFLFAAGCSPAEESVSQAEMNSAAEPSPTVEPTPTAAPESPAQTAAESAPENSETEFLASMGCTDENCTDPSHYHHCVEGCTDPAHYHDCPEGCTEHDHTGSHHSEEGHHSSGHHT